MSISSAETKVRIAIFPLDPLKFAPLLQAKIRNRVQRREHHAYSNEGGRLGVGAESDEARPSRHGRAGLSCIQYACASCPRVIPSGLTERHVPGAAALHAIL
jgi:hypothetical protein